MIIKHNFSYRKVLVLDKYYCVDMHDMIKLFFRYGVVKTYLALVMPGSLVQIQSISLLIVAQR